MRTLFIAVAVIGSVWATGMELSLDSGPAAGVMSPSSANFGVDFPLPEGNPWFLNVIKYYVWPGWHDSVVHGLGVACWKFVDGVPGPITCLLNSVPLLNPNSDGGWVIQAGEPYFNLTTNCPNGFLAGINFLYSYPTVDGFGIDNTGPGPYDWAWMWGESGEQFLLAREVRGASSMKSGNLQVETESMGFSCAIYK